MEKGDIGSFKNTTFPFNIHRAISFLLFKTESLSVFSLTKTEVA